MREESQELSEERGGKREARGERREERGERREEREASIDIAMHVRHENLFNST